MTDTDLITRGDAADDVHDRRLFRTAASLKLEPKDTPKRHDDLSQIRVVDRDSPEGQAILAERAARRALRDRIEGVTSSNLALAGKLAAS